MMIRSKLEVVSRMATLFHRATGNVPTKTSSSTNSIITYFPNQVTIMVLLDTAGTYSIIIKSRSSSYSLDINYEQFFRTVVLPIEGTKLDLMYVNYEGDFQKTFLGELFMTLGELPETYSKQGSVKGQVGSSRRGDILELYKKDTLIRWAADTKICGERLNMEDIKNSFVDDDQIKEKKERKERKRIKKEAKRLQERKKRDEVNVEDYPLYYPEPLSGFNV